MLFGLLAASFLSPPALFSGEVSERAATGSGSDVADYRSRLLLVDAPGVGFLQGSTAIHVQDPRGEGRTLHRSYTQRVRAAGLLQDRQQLHVVLGGFDLRSSRDPDKLSGLGISVGEVRYVGEEVAFDVDLSLRLDCDSAECDIFDRAVDYDVAVMWTLLAADDQVRVQTTTMDSDYSWVGKKGAELESSSFVRAGTIQGEPDNFSQAFTAFRGIFMDLDDDHHYQEWATVIRPLAYDPVQGSARVGLSLLFKQWNQRSRARLLSYADRGSARVRADIALFQLRQGWVEEEVVEGSVHWKATGGAARVDNSKVQQVLF